MRMFQQPETKPLPMEHRVDRSTYEKEIELTGQRLDAVRKTLSILGKSKKTAWARKHWREVEQHLLKKWEMLLYKLDSGIVEVRSGRYRPFKVDYNFWEGTEEIDAAISATMFAQFFDPADLQDRLNESWARAKEDLLKKARQGLI